MNIIGIDPATKKLGVGVLKVTKRGKLKFVDAIEVAAPDKWKINDRLRYIRKEVDGIFKQYKPGLVGMESQFLKRNVASFRLVCYSVGLVWASVIDHTPADVHIFEATKWRSLALGKGNANEEEAIDKMSKMFKLDPSGLTDNMAEALGIAVAVHKAQ